MTKNRWLRGMFMRVLIGVFALAMAGCTTVGAGVSAMSGELTDDWKAGSNILDHKQEFTSIYAFGSTKYTETSVGSLSGTIKVSENRFYEIAAWESNITGGTFNFYFKYPFSLLDDRLTLFPMGGADIHLYQQWFDFGNAFTDTMLYLKIGGGLDINFSKLFFLRGRVMYTPIAVSGLTFNLGIGYRTQSDEVRQRYRTVAEMAAEKKRAEEKAAADAKAREMEAIQDGDMEAYQNALARDPNDPDPYYYRGWYYYYYRTQTDKIAAAAEWEKALEIAPHYAIKKGIEIPAATAAKEGFTNLEQDLDLSGVHLNLLIGLAYFELVTTNKAPEAEHDGYLEKALAYFQAGYDHDITEGKNNTKDGKTAYLLYIGNVREKRGDLDGAIAAYQEISNTKVRYLKAKKQAIAAFEALAAKSLVYYVSAAGNNDNDGLSEAKAFKTLTYAVEKAAASGTIKTVAVIGTLNKASEGGGGDSIFDLHGNDSETSILITGIPNAPAAKRAALSAQGTKEQNCVTTTGGGTFRFEYIEISGSAERGITIGASTTVTLGAEARVANNNGGGVFAPGPLIMDGGIVENNKTEGIGGGGISVWGAFTMKWGSVRNNTAAEEGSMGGGIFIMSTEPVSIEGGDITGNKAGFGGGICIFAGSVTMTGGTVSGNTAAEGVGGVSVEKGATFNNRGGAISGNFAPSTTRAETHNLWRFN